jgi:hypothetical protein
VYLFCGHDHLLLYIHTSWIHSVLDLVAMLFITPEHGYAYLGKRVFLLFSVVGFVLRPYFGDRHPRITVSLP